MASALPMAREASGCSNSARDACVAVALGRAHQEPAPSHGSPLTTSHAPCGRGQNPLRSLHGGAPPPRSSSPALDGVSGCKSHTPMLGSPISSQGPLVSRLGVQGTQTQSISQLASVPAGAGEGGDSSPPVRGPRALLASRLGTLMFTMCHKVHVTGVCCLLFTVAGSGHSRGQCGVRCGHAQCGFRTRPCAARGRTRPCAALSPVHARQAPGGGRSLRQGQAPG